MKRGIIALHIAYSDAQQQKHQRSPRGLAPGTVTSAHLDVLSSKSGQEVADELSILGTVKSRVDWHFKS